ncbi:hypothetical protein M404DRAFT_675272 [Pisolithus tinctorius Marx 270]|uniref:Uncharacterized protein n=1 Tax=Pisolithus tinctorius Marx 270 TaxID=870435 RepID=A0A0C3JTD9_PISTI|nr:hypothetical protein M404DRAFT_675272 [Pisolithus tinctorius Marx 270]
MVCTNCRTCAYVSPLGVRGNHIHALIHAVVSHSFSLDMKKLRYSQPVPEPCANWFRVREPGHGRGGLILS